MAGSKQAITDGKVEEEKAKSFSCTMHFLFNDDDEEHIEITNNLDRRKRLMTFSSLGLFHCSQDCSFCNHINSL